MTFDVNHEISIRQEIQALNLVCLQSKFNFPLTNKEIRSMKLSDYWCCGGIYSYIKELVVGADVNGNNRRAAHGLITR